MEHSSINDFRPCQGALELGPDWIVEMESLLKGRLRNTHLAVTKAMIPVFEAVVNSIHAIEDDAADDGRAVRDHRIDVRVYRSPQASLKLEGKMAPRESGASPRSCQVSPRTVFFSVFRAASLPWAASQPLAISSQDNQPSGE